MRLEEQNHVKICNKLLKSANAFLIEREMAYETLVFNMIKAWK
jgi:hypothetical protein